MFAVGAVVEVVRVAVVVVLASALVPGETETELNMVYRTLPPLLSSLPDCISSSHQPTNFVPAHNLYTHEFSRGSEQSFTTIVLALEVLVVGNRSAHKSLAQVGTLDYTILYFKDPMMSSLSGTINVY